MLNYNMLSAIQSLITLLKRTREAKKLSQKALADKLGIPQSHLSNIEAGKVNIKLASFVEMARMLELEVMLIPRQDVSWVKSIMEAKLKTGEVVEIKPAYRLDDEKEEER